MNYSLSERIGRYAITATILWCMVCIFITMRFFTYTGDDLIFLRRWQDCFSENGWLGYPVFFCRHWLSTNGRMANELSPLLLSWLPRIIADIILSVAYGSLIIFIIRFALPRKGFFCAKSLAIFLIVCTLPWWDSLLLYDCWLNYPIAALLGLIAIWLILRKGKIYSRFLTIVLALFTFIAGAMHEACGVPLAAGLIVWWCICRPVSLRSRKGLLIIAFVAGALFAIASPGIWNRFGMELTGARSWWWTILISCFYSLLLILYITISLLTHPGRNKLSRLLKSPWIIFVVAAIVASLFCAVSGIIGRSGFFAQIFSIIAIFMMMAIKIIRISRFLAAICGCILLLIVIFHTGAVAWWQNIAGNELNTTIEEYSASADGLVYLDYTTDSAIPWWTLHKVRGVPDADDVWTLHTITAYYGNPDKKPLIVLPAAMRDFNPSTITDSISFGNTIIMRQSPATTPLYTQENITLQRTMINKKEYIVTSFAIGRDSLYRIELRDIDPGD